jgi:hypothetical protein
MSRAKAALVNALGAQDVFDEDPIMGSEEFGLLGPEGHRIPTVMFWLGAMDPLKAAAAQAAGRFRPGPHTSLFEAVPGPTARTGVNCDDVRGNRATSMEGEPTASPSHLGNFQWYLMKSL